MRVGHVEILALRDAVGAVGGLGDLFPGSSSEAWEPYRALYPDLFDDGRWHVACTSYLVRAEGHLLLVDTGLGGHDFYDEPALSQGLLPALAQHGVEPADIDTVFLTHLHIDHVGSTTAFPSARFLLHRDAVSAARKRADLPHIPRCVLSVLREGRVDEIEDGTEVMPGVVAVELEGHDAGHTGLRIGTEAIVVGDAAVHPAQLDQPEWQFVPDADAERCASTREALLEEVADTGVLVISSHYPGSGIGRVTRSDGRVIWEGVDRTE